METNKLLQSFQESWNSFIDRVPEILMAILIIAIGTFVANKI
ncbi:hypothetical protein OK344_09675 [Kaistella sp. BT6-1-3]|uniref:Uncharacterized protein n=2 Tax=Kaistella TaxID=2782231 RepID=A0ABT3JNZ5_9FLAO|nr:hypothetical protein [Kaistella yananensis]MCW4452478.1 hypothetical protein [Kaistella yananensis]